MNKDFQSWWNDRYFYTNDPIYSQLYDVYKRLFEAGADLDYIEGICQLLFVADDDVNFQIEDVSKNTPHKFLSLGHPSGRSRRIKEGIVRAEKELGIRLDKNSIKEVESEIRGKLKEHLENQQKRLEEKFKRTSEAVFKKNPIDGILMEYASGQLLYTTGQRSDDVGSFFLLAISEHLREKRRQPKYALAAKLLQEVRQNSKSLSRLDAMVRVDKLKKSHPNWKLHLKALKNSYRKRTSDAHSNLFAKRSFQQSLAKHFAPGSDKNLNDIYSRLKSLSKEHFPDAPEFSRHDFNNLIRPILKDK